LEGRLFMVMHTVTRFRFVVVCVVFVRRFTNVGDAVALAKSTSWLGMAR
jgi:hypothetical protein